MNFMGEKKVKRILIPKRTISFSEKKKVRRPVIKQTAHLFSTLVSVVDGLRGRRKEGNEELNQMILY